MAPLLIDSRDLVKYIFMSVVVMVMVFAVGFSLGHERAATFYQAGSVVQSLALPEHVAASESDIGSQLPEEIAAGEDIDVDSPEATASETVDLEKIQLPQKLAANKSGALLKERDKKAVAIKNGAEDKTTVDQKQERSGTGLKVSALENGQINNQSSDKESTAKKDVSVQQPGSPVAAIETAFTSGQNSKIKYSIQVGMYGRLHNAENMVSLLQSKNYKAYISDYTNKKNETRYNVRFGYFPDKKSAIASLDKFKSDQHGDGYLVRFSADNIVNVAGAADVDQAVNVPAHGDGPVIKEKPSDNPVDFSQDKISQADVLNDKLTNTN